MEQTNQNQKPQNNQPQFKCPGNCLQCLPAQRQYCASQHAYSNMMVLDRVMETLTKMQGAIQEISVKIEAIQNSEAAVFATSGEGELFPKEFAKELATE